MKYHTSILLIHNPGKEASHSKELETSTLVTLPTSTRAHLSSVRNCKLVAWETHSLTTAAARVATYGHE